jgi:hypothetical protein
VISFDLSSSPGGIISLILKMKKLRLREVKQLVFSMFLEPTADLLTALPESSNPLSCVYSLF